MIALATVLGLVGAAFALRLHPTAATSTFVSSSSPEYRATQQFYKNFGEEPIEVLVKGDLQQLVLSSDVDRLVGLEGCLSGNVPAQALAQEGGVDGPCGQLAKAKTVKVVFGPGTFINEAAEQIDEQLTNQTKQAEAAAKQAEAVSCARRRSRAGKALKKRTSSASRRARSRSRASRRGSRRWRCSTGSPRGRAWTTRASSRRWCSTRTSRRARRRRASPTCSRAAKRR